MTEKTLSSRTVFRGRLLVVETLEVETPAGRRATREIVRHPGAAVILARRADGRFVLVRQYRKPVECELLEAIAGKLDPNEQPEDCARRETREETGYAVRRLRKLGETYSSPGFCDEILHVFFAELGEAGAPRPEDDESVEPVFLTAADIEARIADGALRDAKTLAAWTLFRLRGSG